MTATPTVPESAVREACSQLGLSARDIAVIRSHATPVFLLPGANAVARVKPLAEEADSARGIALLRWLTDQGFPAVEPLDVPQPVQCGPYVVTLWVRYSQHRTGAPPPSALGTLLRQLHELPVPPVELPPYQPLASLHDAVTSSSTLSPDDRRWLESAVEESRSDYRALRSPLGQGFVHGDAYPGNTLWDGDTVRLADWDEAAFGPRELDLANTFQGARFGRTRQEIEEFVRHYGHDPSHWPGLRTLITMRDLHTLASFIRRADGGDPSATAQLSHRLTTLRTGRAQARWDVY
ncbi:phosphotransferase enzyme family protein [Streptomyces uncialis]|uniref:phosphotransferase enzyme family protein n=1 Tax=Streptomyces uncialis TaxID=1048205 RepID=UPI0037A196FA